MTAPVRALLLAAGTLAISVPGLAQSQLSATPNPVALNGTNLNVQVAVSGSGPFTVQTSGSFFGVSTTADTAPTTFTVSVTNTVCSNGNVPCNGSITLHPTAAGGGTDVSIPVTFTPGPGGGVGGAPISANPNPVTLSAFPNQSVTTTVTLSTNSVTPIPFNVSFSPQNSWLLVTITNSQVSASGTSPGSATMTIFANATGITTSQTGSITLTPTNGSPQTVIPVALNITGSTGSTYSANPPNAALVYPGSPQSQQVTVNSNNFNVSTFNAQVANCSGGNFLLLTTASGSGTLLTNQPVSGALVLSLINAQNFATGSYSCQVVVSNPANSADQIVIPVVLTVNGGGGFCTQPLCVNRTDDNAFAPVSGMLRYAVLNAPKGAVITFDPALNGQTILLDITSPNNALRITQDLTIQGPGALTISGGSSTRIFFVAGGNVSISGLTLANGFGKGFDGAGGGNGGGGAAGMGGAIFMNGGFLTLTGVVLSGNRAQGGNGGQGTGGGGNSGGGGGFASAGFGGQGGNGGDLGGIGGAPGPSGTVGLPGISGGSGAGGGGGGNSTSGAPGAGGNGGFAAGGGAGGIGCFAVSGGSNGGAGAGGIGGFGAGSGAGSSSGASFGGGSGAVVSNTANCGAVAGGGGGGGAAFGGAIFVSAGSLLAVNTTFLSNLSVGAPGGNGAGSGQSKGGALFVCSASFCGAGHDASVILTGSTLFQGNVASSAGAATLCPGRDDSDVCGSIASSVATHFSVSTPASATPGGPFSYTVTALDAANNIVFTYAGLVHFNSSDPRASLPGDSTLTAGVGTFTAVLNTLGNQTISATDTAALFVTGTSAPVAVSNSGAFSAVSVNPSFGGGLSSSFNFVFNDSNGAQDLDVVNILINNFLDGRQACYLAYSVPQNVLYLVNDAGTALQSGLVLNGAGGIGNSQCNVIGFGSTAQKNGSFLTLTLNLTFSAAFGGNKVVYLAARSLTQNTGWQPLGVWTVPGAPATSPSVGAVTPARGSGLNQSFTFSFADSFGKTDIGIVNILINNALDGRQSCYLAYSRPLNTLYLVNDAGSGLLPGLTLNGTGSTSNSQCAVDGSLSSVSGTGSLDALTLTLNLTFAPTFGGNRIVYVAARNLTDTSNSGWQAAATWTVQ